jgi:hypothetical protein
MYHLESNIMQYSEDDLQLVKQEAARRVDHKGGWPLDFNEKKKTQQETVEEGLLGEKAYATYYQIPLDQRLLGHDKGDGGVDLVLDGMTIDVKATKIPRGRLAFTGLPHSSDYLALAIIDTHASTVRLAGMISTERFRRDCYIEDLGYGNRYLINQSDLDPILPIALIDKLIDITPPLTVSTTTLEWITNSIPEWREKYWNPICTSTFCKEGEHKEYALHMLTTVLLDYRTIIQGEPPKKVVSV